MLRRAGLGALAIVALPGILAAQDPPPRAPAQPDAGLLEFLGSVDGLSEVSPDYLSQGRVHPGHLPGAGGVRPVTAPPSTPPPTAPTSPPLAQGKS